MIPDPKSPGPGPGGGDPGTLYIVATPIGHLEDMTFRAVEVLNRVDLIAAEGVRHSGKLLKHYGIKTRLTRYNQHNEREKAPVLLEALLSGSHVAYITNAGTPGVSDPGTTIIRRARELNIRVSPIPGPSALTAALSVSGMRSDGFLFSGFLPNRPGKRRKALEGLSRETRSMVFFEAPHRLAAMLADLKEVFGDREMVLLRELTKVYEEVKGGQVSHILKGLERDGVRGECTLVVAGFEKVVKEAGIREGVREEIEGLLSGGGMSVRDIASKISQEQGLPFRPVYKECLAIKRYMRVSLTEP